MAKIKGYDGSIKAGGNIVGEVKNFSLEISTDIVDTTVLGSNGWRSNTATIRGWSGSAQALFDADDAGQDNLRAVLMVGNSIDVEFYLGKNEAGNIKYTGTAIIKSASITNDVAGIVEISVSFEGDGELTETTIS